MSLKKEFSSLDFEDDLLELVGKLPCNLVERDREIIREAASRTLTLYFYQFQEQ
ncbi:MAG: hypothetical protein QXG44_12550 [Candidatus Jordarchaeaceae archaeon]